MRRKNARRWSQAKLAPVAGPASIGTCATSLLVLPCPSETCSQQPYLARYRFRQAAFANDGKLVNYQRCGTSSHEDTIVDFERTASFRCELFINLVGVVYVIT